jgi:hypothetical protein
MSSRIEVTVTYNLTEDEFRALPEDFPTGEYHSGGENDGTEWYRVNIESPNGVIKLTWFLK